MSRYKIAYILSIVVLGVMIASVVLQPMMAGDGRSEVQREQLLKIEDQWIIQFNLVNNEGKDQDYTINVVIDGKQSSESVLVGEGRVFTYIYHIYRDRLTDGHVGFAVYKDGEADPFEEATYYLN